MKYKILIFAIAVIGIGAGVLFWMNQSQPASSEKSTEQTPQAYSRHWGVLIRAFALDSPGAPYSKDHLVQQLDFAKELKVSDVRSNAETNQLVNDDFVALAQERNLTVTLVLEPPRFFEDGTYQSMYEYGKAMATRYKGKVAYYQLGNEASGVAVKAGYSGSKESDYDEKRYSHFKDLVRGLSDGVYAGDTQAKRIISAHWLGVGVMDRLVKDNIHFEVIGWDWYSDMGNDLSKLVDGQILDIPGYLSKYNKEFWVTEVNDRNGSLKGTDAQATFLQTFITNALKRSSVKGIFVFALTDQCGDLGKDEGRMGLVELTRSSDLSCSIVGKKTAFTTFQNLIAQYR